MILMGYILPALMSLCPGGIVAAPLALWQIHKSTCVICKMTLMTCTAASAPALVVPCVSSCSTASTCAQHKLLRPLWYWGSHQEFQHGTPSWDIWFSSISPPGLCGIKQVKAILPWHCHRMEGSLTQAMITLIGSLEMLISRKVLGFSCKSETFGLLDSHLWVTMD